LTGERWCANKTAEGRHQVIGRLSAFDLPGRLRGRVSGAVVQAAVGVALGAAALLLRAGLEPLAPLAPGVAPFCLLFPAILLATGLAGWRAGALALLTGALIGLHFLLPPNRGVGLGLREFDSLGLLIVSGTLVIGAAAAYRATALALRESQQRLDLATSAAKVGVWEWRLDTDEMIYSDEAKRIFGFPLGKRVTLDAARAAVHPDDRPAVDEALACARDPAVRDESPHEYRILWPGGEVRWVHVGGRVLFQPGKDGRPVADRYVGVVQDVTARKADDERLRLLAREVDHRANNLLAVVQGTVALSEAEDSTALKSVITGRVGALARAHQQLAQARWEGADLRRLVEEELLAFSIGDEARASVRGPTVTLAPAAAQSVAMALHELATNAAKYGALSTPHGRVEVSWRRDAGGALRISWRETGGPRVEKPARKGLGTTLLQRALSGPFRGGASLDWRGEGLVCELMLPSEALDPATGERPGAREAASAAEPASGSAR
jgi:two-component sensor histidine kinase